MLSVIAFGVFFLGLLSTLFSLAKADSVPASVFILPLDNNSGNYTFALNIPENSEDVYFHLSGPASYSWIAVGTGTEMKDSLMFIVYSNAQGDGVTVSPRLATGETEPVFSSSLDVTELPGTGLSDNTMTVNARCSNCQRWKTGSLDLNSTAQPWIYALGPHSGNSVTLKSDSKTASIERHSEYGRFSMDMVLATGGSGGLPTSFTTAVGSAEIGQPHHDSNWPSIIHALAICGAFVLLMPAGVIFLRVFPASVRWHWVNQSLASILAIVGGLIGIYLSTMFTKSESFDSTHQVIGLICVAAVFVQWGLGFWHHRLFKITRQPTKYGPIHRYFGQIIIVLAVVNGGIGLTWSYASTRVIVGYIIVVVVIGVPVIAAVAWKRWTSREAKPEPGLMSEGFPGQYQAGYDSNIDLVQYSEQQYHDRVQ
ncbi:hypothetical protein VTN77DRAFT_9847 [Rasamsonia byssochlamydoides]|uniref:uncharacterized protein n=1 Tax=Rasamsonia byssochlamydoides TaxID=89139 RepID=UPI003742F644